MTDVLLRLFANGGQIEYIGGVVTLSDGLETAAFLSLFGGNERDRGIEADDSLQWWGNLIERDDDRRYRSRTQAIVRSLPLVPANLRRVEEAAGLDLTWFVESKLARFVRVIASIPALNRLRLDVEIEIQDELFRFAFLVDDSGDDVESIGGPVQVIADGGEDIVDDFGNLIIFEP